MGFLVMKFFLTSHETPAFSHLVMSVKLMIFNDMKLFIKLPLKLQLGQFSIDRKKKQHVARETKAHGGGLFRVSDWLPSTSPRHNHLDSYISTDGGCLN